MKKILFRIERKIVKRYCKKWSDFYIKQAQNKDLPAKERKIFLENAFPYDFVIAEIAYYEVKERYNSLFNKQK